jgi:ubiquinone/menaquinone biosynthesis C-methylase UbiE
VAVWRVLTVDPTFIPSRPRFWYRRSMHRLSWVLRVLLAALVLSGGIVKLAGNADAVASFERLGLGQWFRIFTGLCEVAGGVGLLITPLAGLAALGLALVMVGAVAAHFLVLGGSAAPAIVVLVLCLAVAWLERTGLRVLRVLVTGKGPMDGWLARAYDRGIQDAFRDILPPLVEDLVEQVKSARSVLDAGCGPGQFTVMMAERLPNAEVWGIDLAPAMIDLARTHAAASPAAARLHFQIGDVAQLPFPDGEFDLVLSSGSIKHWPDPVAGLREIHRVLARGGQAFIGEMNRLAPPAAVATQAAKARSWVMQRIYPRALAHALSPDEAVRVFSASPFGAPVNQRMLLDGCFWLFEARKGA